MEYVQAFESPPVNTGQIKLYDAEAFAKMSAVGSIAAEALDMLVDEVRPGVTTEHLDRLAYGFALDRGCIPAPLNYRGFPKSICTSVNQVVCHGIPNAKKLREGDILNIDITFIKDGWHGDSSRMYYVGDVPRKAARLVKITYEAMMRGIGEVRPGTTLGDIGAAIQTFAEENRYSIVRDFCGHGIGLVFHDAPNILHYGKRGEGITLREGMCFTIEPMINLGKPEVKLLNDGWTAVTRDRSLSAQFEHSIGVSADGAVIFTRSPTGRDCPPY
ncbi:MAG: type I methionyl aminopeptidase [Hyphomicrobiales bacterium]|nr:type I methionyl aminopeptidase [Hyphomicrobiales bacterium]MCY4048351.1 type I methionyl aminopeptidase [Hyphomicrobiales bacterium]MCY4053900.1 type I methionyl aminopeptidase [Hyphomicrobiales bacterium]